MNTAPFIIAHRGDSSHAPENTIAAFRMAIEKGSDGVEFDVQLSADGIPVVIHDHDLRRTAGRAEKIDDLTAAELTGIDVGSWFNKRYPHLSNQAFGNEGVPTLEAVLETVGNCRGPIYIELKALDENCAQLAQNVCEVIRDSAYLDRMIVKSFRLSAIPIVRKCLPDVQTAALFAPDIMTFLRRRRRIVAIAQEVGAQQLSIHYSLVSTRLMRLAKEAEMPVTIWTADDARWVDRCQKFGIRALITNDPAKQLARRVETALQT